MKPTGTIETRTAGFTLLELSIVLVIIGLLIGGIFVGQSLIHTAQLNAVVSEFNRYQTSVQNFKMQYQALPGDMTNATSFWGSAGGTGSDDACSLASTSGSLATCNGNGDGTIQAENGTYGELFWFWKHLANAKMIEGSFTGSATSNGTANTATPGVNIPQSRYSPFGWNAYNGAAWANRLYSAGIFATDYGQGNLLILGAAPGVWLSASAVAAIPVKDVWSIDKKIDDGKPAQGNVMTYWNGGCTTASDQTHLEATYSLSPSSSTCVLIFLTSF